MVVLALFHAGLWVVDLALSSSSSSNSSGDLEFFFRTLFVEVEQYQ